jgi:hypothetical protein
VLLLNRLLVGLNRVWLFNKNSAHEYGSVGLHGYPASSHVHERFLLERKNGTGF